MSGDDLFRAAQRGDLDVFRRLLVQLLYTGAPSSVFASAMVVAIWNDHGNIVAEIAYLAGNNKLELAARHGSTEAARALLQFKPSIPEKSPNALSHAAIHGHVATVALLVSFGASASSRALALSAAAENGCKPAVRTLIRAGADVNSRNWFNCTALHRAAACGQAHVVAQLLYFKADVHSRSDNGKTALDLTSGRSVATAAVLRRFEASSAAPL